MSTKNPRFTLIVNSCDPFEDCWIPFFTMLESHWPDLDAKIILVTEKKTFSFGSLDITCAQVQGDGDRLVWGECLIRAIGMVETPLILYLQEDYFIEKAVRNDLVNRFADQMLADPSIYCFGLTHFGSQGPYHPTNDPMVKVVDQRAHYRICSQASLWRKEAILEYLHPEEDGWMFELLGSRRAWRRKQTFLTIDPVAFHPVTGTEAPIFQYTHTGIIKGKWHPAMPALFADHGVEMDFSKRGFFVPKPRWRERLVTLRRLLQRPNRAWKGLFGR